MDELKPGDKITVAANVVVTNGRRHLVFRQGVVSQRLDENTGDEAFEYTWDTGDGRIDYISGNAVIDNPDHCRGIKWALGWEGEEVDALKAARALR